DTGLRARLGAGMEQERDPLVVRGKGRVIACAEIRECRAPVAYLDRHQSRQRPLVSRGIEDNPTAVIRPSGHTRADLIRYRFVGDESRPPLEKIQHVYLIPIAPIRTEPRGMALEHV